MKHTKFWYAAVALAGGNALFFVLQAWLMTIVPNVITGLVMVANLVFSIVLYNQIKTGIIV